MNVIVITSALLFRGRGGGLYRIIWKFIIFKCQWVALSTCLSFIMLIRMLHLRQQILIDIHLEVGRNMEEPVGAIEGHIRNARYIFLSG